MYNTRVKNTQQLSKHIFDYLYVDYGIKRKLLISSMRIIVLFALCIYAHSCAFISVIELPRIPAYCPKVTLITRPRRFGKTLAMSMLANFFDIRQKNESLFQGLAVSSDSSLCKEWMNQWPVVFLSLKNIDGLTFSTAYQQLAYEIGLLFEKHKYLLTDEKIGPAEKELFERLKNRSASEVEVSRSLQFLLQLMTQHYGKSAILLLDEYDVPLAKANSNRYYKEMLEIIRAIMITALKDNPSLCFAVITGCLRISKESIFTGTNNFVSDTITDSHLDEYFGFTQKDVDQLLADTDAQDHADDIKNWYDGYHFGDFDVYCPWDVMNYLRDLQRNPKALPSSYWKNTSDNAIIRSFIDYAGSSITRKLETLLSGGYIIQEINENLTYDYLHSSEENLWSVLYLTGYLTCLKDDTLSLPAPSIALVIPNAEIREIFETTIIQWFDDSARSWNRKPLFDAIWAKNCAAATEEMNRLLRKTISYHDYKEDFYHAFLAGIFAGAGYTVESNREHGEGRSDVVVYDSENGRVAVFEIKYAQTSASLPTACEAALTQIATRMYAQEFEDDYDQIYCYGIAFFKKRCLIEIEAK